MSAYGKLVRSAAEHYVRTRELLPVPASLPAELSRQRACYITVFENPGRHFRSLYGNPLPQQSTLAREIIVNAVEALTHDAARVVRRPDLQYLTYTIAVLDPLQRVSDAEHLDPHRFGVYVQSDRGKSSVLLPQRAGVESGEDQIATVLREANIDTRAESYILYRFAVTFFDE